jgi:glycosyltransferase involved in cell wall biosynthesis
MDETAQSAPDSRRKPIRIGFIVHVLQVAGAEVLVAETIRRLGPSISPVVFCLDALGQLGEQLTAEGIPVVTLDRKPGLDFACINRLAREIQERNLDVLHAHQYTPFFYGGLAARKAGIGTRVVFTEHGRHFPDVVSWRRRLTNRLLLRRLADRVTAVCDFSRQALARQDGFLLDSIEVIENGIDVERYSCPRDVHALRLSLGLQPERRYVSCIARFHPVKDHRMLINAFGELASESADTDLVLVGDGPLRADLEAQVTSLGLTGRVHFLGVRGDVPRILAAVDVFVLTSVSEAASITLLEAMATGLPVVVTDVGGNPEIVRDQVDGLLVPRGDARATAAALRMVLSDRERSAAFGRAGRQRAFDHYRLERTIKRYHDLYASLSDLRSATAG